MPEYIVSYSASTTYIQVVTADSAEQARELVESQEDPIAQGDETSYGIDIDDVEEFGEG